MSRNLGDAYISILPDASNFRRLAKEAVEKALTGVEGDVGLGINDKLLGAEARAAVEKAAREAGVLNVKTNVDTSGLRKAGDEILAQQNRVAKARDADAKNELRQRADITKMFTGMFDTIDAREAATEKIRQGNLANLTKTLNDQMKLDEKANAARLKQADQQAKAEAKAAAAQAKADERAAATEAKATDQQAKADERAAAARLKQIDAAAKAESRAWSTYGKNLEATERLEDERTKKRIAAETAVAAHRARFAEAMIKVGLDDKGVETEAKSLWARIRAVFGRDIKQGIDLNDKGVAARANALRVALLAIFGKDIKQGVDLDDAGVKTRASALRVVLTAIFSRNLKQGVDLNDGGVKARAIGLRAALGVIFSNDIKQNVDINRDRLTRGAADAFNGLKRLAGNSGNATGNSFSSSLTSSLGQVFNRKTGIAAIIIAGMAALPAAVGVVGAAIGVGLGVAIIAAATATLIKKQSQLTKILATIRKKTGDPNAGLDQGTPAQQVQGEALQKQIKTLLLFQATANRARSVWEQLKTSMFSAVADSGFLKAANAALSSFQKSLKTLQPLFTSLFAAAAPLIQPFVDFFVLLIQNLLPGLTTLLSSAGGQIGIILQQLGSDIGFQLGEWFKAAAPYMAVSGKYLHILVTVIGDLVTWLIKFGGEFAKAFDGSAWKGFGKTIAPLGDSLLKLVVPAFQAWSSVMAPIAAQIIKILVPLLNFLAQNPALVKALTVTYLAWSALSKVPGGNKVLSFTVKTIGKGLGALLGIGSKTASVSVASGGMQAAGDTMVTAAGRMQVAADTMAGGGKGKAAGTAGTAAGTAAPAAEKSLGAKALGLGGAAAGGALLVAGLVLKFRQDLTQGWNTVVTDFVPKAISGLGGVLTLASSGIANAVIKPVEAPIRAFWVRVEHWAAEQFDKIRHDISSIFAGVRHDVAAAWDALLKAAQPVFNALANFFIGIWTGIRTTAVQAWNAIKSATATAWNAVKGVLSAVWNWIKSAASTVFNTVKNVVTTIWNNLKGNTAAVWNGVKGVLSAVWNWIKSAAGAVFNSVKNVVTTIWNSLRGATSTIWNGVKGVLSAIWNWIKSAAGAVFNTVKNVVTTVWNSLKGATAAIWNGIKGVLSTIWNWVKSAAGAVFNTVKNVVTTVWNGIKGATIAVWNAVKGALSTIWNWIKSAAGAVWNGVRNTVVTVWNAIKNATIAVWNAVKGALSTVWNWAKAAASAVWSAMRNTIVTVWNVIKAATIAVWNAVKGALTTVWNWAKAAASAVWSAMRNTIVTVWNVIKAATIAVWNAIKGALTTIWNWAKAAASAVWTALRNTITTVWNVIKSATIAVWNAIKGALTTVWNWMKGAASVIWSAVRNTVTTVWNSIKGATSTIWNGIKSTIGGIWNGIKSTIRTAVDWIHDTVVGVWQKLQTTSAAIWRAIGDGLSAGVNAGKHALADSVNFVTQDIINPVIRGYNAANDIWSGADITQIPRVNFAKGGRVPGYAPGSDTIPAMLSPGEFVMNPVAAKAIGYDNLHEMNRAGPGRAPRVTDGTSEKLAKGGTPALNLGAYRNPLPNPTRLTPTRIDQGVDFQGAGPMAAIGSGRILNTTGGGWPGGPYMSMKLSEGPLAGMAVYYSENIRPLVHVGQNVKAGEHIANWFDGGTGIELGFDSGSGSQPLSQTAAAGSISGANLPGGGTRGTAVGKLFDELLVALGLPKAPNYDLPTGGSLPGNIPGAKKGDSGGLVQQLASLAKNAPGGGGGGIDPKQQKKYDAFMKLLDFNIKNYSAGKTGTIGSIVKGIFSKIGQAGKTAGKVAASVATGKQYTGMGGNVSSLVKPAAQKNYDAAAAAASGPGSGPAGGANGSQMANGKQLYEYLLANVFHGKKVAAAGATAAIWGESMWDPKAQGTGGRGLIGWTPPGTISDADFSGGMRTQLPAIIKFLTQNDDWGRVSQVAGANSVEEAANLWGRLIERFGINDVHGPGIALATKIAGLQATTVTKAANGGYIPGYAPGHDTVPAMLSPGEFVMNPRAVRAVGVDNLHSMNNANPAHGGPHKAIGLPGYYASGGEVDIFGASNARRLSPYIHHPHVNSGIEGNLAVRDNARFARSITGTNAALLWEGYNDIAAGTSAAAVAGANAAKITAAHKAGIPVVLGSLQSGTITNRTRLAQITEYNKWAAGAADAYTAIGADIPKGQVHGDSLAYTVIARSVDARFDTMLKKASTAKVKAADAAAAVKGQSAAARAAAAAAAGAARVLALGRGHSRAGLEGLVTHFTTKLNADAKRGDASDYAGTAAALADVNLALSKYASPAAAEHDAQAAFAKTALANAKAATAKGDQRGFMIWNQKYLADAAKVKALDAQINTPAGAAPPVLSSLTPVQRLAYTLGTADSKTWDAVAYQLRNHSIDPTATGKLSKADMSSLALNVTPSVLDVLYAGPGASGANWQALATALTGDLFNNSGIYGAGSGKALALLGKLTGQHGQYSGKKFAQGGWINEPVSGIGLTSGMPYSFGENGRREKVIPEAQVHNAQGMTEATGRALLMEMRAGNQIAAAAANSNDKALGGAGRLFR